jgi:hypothetical protein
VILEKNPVEQIMEKFRSLGRILRAEAWRERQIDKNYLGVIEKALSDKPASVDEVREERKIECVKEHKHRH